MFDKHHPDRTRAPWLLSLLLVPLVACDDGDDGRRGPPGLPGGSGTTNEDLDKDEAAPGIVVAVQGVSGGSGPGGRFRVGDKLRVNFTVEKDDGTSWDLAELDTTRALMSGPTFSYQRVLAEVSDVGAEADRMPDGSYTYTFATPIPATYLPPLNDTPSFDADDGELTGQPLLDGTYTVGIYFAWNYTVDGVGHRDAGDATFDFLLGAAGTIQPREVVTTEGCNRCHDELQFHGGLRRSSTLCLLCHTAGSEDRNGTVLGGTPGASIDFKVMVHKIHNGAHLPSVLGVTTDVNGDRDYTATPEPYQLVGFSVGDFSEVRFPAWPNASIPMPRDAGHSALSPAEQALEDEIRRGVTSCYLCHGDPDGAGPVEAPAQGDLAYSQPARNACGSCHDDWVFDRPYTANLSTMPPQLSDGACKLCHPIAGTNLAVMDGHLHPLRDPSFAQGFDLGILAVSEAGTNDGDGTVDPGEEVEVTFTIRDSFGDDIDPAVLQSINATVTGPTHDYNLLETTAIPLSTLTGAQPYTVPVSSIVHLEHVGDDGPGLQAFPTARAPHRNVAGALTEVRAQTGTSGGSSMLSGAVAAPANFIDVDDPTGFERNDYLVIDAGTPDEEYLQIQLVDGDRLWFSSPQTPAYAPGTRLDHGAGTPVQEVQLSLLVEGVDYSLDPGTGTVTELANLGTGLPVLVTYTTNFVMPSEFPLALNAGPDLGEEHGGWAGKSIVDGTYSLTMWGRRDLMLSLFGETNSYRELAPGVRADFLVGDAATIQPYELIESPESCNSCHVELVFHGPSRRGWDSCLACHGTAASGDRPRYVAANAPETDEVTINFREMIHKIHRGADLANASSYVVVGFGSGYPNNFSEVTFEHIRFPAMPSGVKSCRTCHGDASTAWRSPSNLEHPTEQGAPAQEWRLVCGSCHDDADAGAHIDAQTSPFNGAESCAICHGTGQEWEVGVMHMIR